MLENKDNTTVPKPKGIFSKFKSKLISNTDQNYKEEEQENELNSRHQILEADDNSFLDTLIAGTGDECTREKSPGTTPHRDPSVRPKSTSRGNSNK